MKRFTNLSEQNVEVIHQEIDRTWVDIAQKVGALEGQLIGAGVEKAVETVESKLDFSKAVENSPWSMLAGAAATGFLAAYFLKRRKQPPDNEQPPGAARLLVNIVVALADKEIIHLRRQALGFAASLARDLVGKSFPAYRQHINPLVDKLALHLGGQPVDGRVVR